jgi:hypothetical protein
MEEGPEPQEWVERGVEHHHEHQHAPSSQEVQRRTAVSAITAAVLAVFAAFGSLLSGHEANQAIIHQSQASDNWSFYQSKSTKGHVYQVGGEIVKALADSRGTQGEERIKPTLDRFQQQVEKYETEKKPLEDRARELEEESKRELGKHHYFALGIVSFQVGIVLASISILLRHRAVWLLSLVGGLVGIIFLVCGFLAI